MLLWRKTDKTICNPSSFFERTPLPPFQLTPLILSNFFMTPLFFQILKIRTLSQPPKKFYEGKLWNIMKMIGEFHFLKYQQFLFRVAFFYFLSFGWRVHQVYFTLNSKNFVIVLIPSNNRFFECYYNAINLDFYHTALYTL